MDFNLCDHTHYDPYIDRHTSISLDNPEDVSDDDSCWKEEEDLLDSNDTDDTMNIMDDYYRPNELFVRRDKHKSKAPNYDMDDVALSDNIKYRYIPPSLMYPHEINTDLEKTYRHKTNEYVYDKSILCSDIFYIMSMGYSYEQALNIYDKSTGLVKDYFMNKDLINESLRLADKKYPIEDILETMDKAVVKKVGRCEYHKGSIDFIDMFPDKREVIISRATENNQNEFYKRNNAEYYKKFYYMAKDKDNVEQILEDCTLNNTATNYCQDSDRLLCYLAEYILDNNGGTWDENASRLMKRVKTKNKLGNELVNGDEYYNVNRFARAGYTSDEILKTINKQNK